ncbi:MAG: Fur family transcriptional regulator [Planctomycetota bacterium]
MSAFQAYLRRRGLKLTVQRSLIAKKVFSSPEHFSAEELFESLKRRGRRAISKATIYRTLALLEDSHLINSVDIERGGHGYEHAHVLGNERTEQLVCVSCYEVLHFEDPELLRYHERLRERLGYEIVSHSLKLFGRCPACLEKERATAPSPGYEADEARATAARRASSSPS